MSTPTANHITLMDRLHSSFQGDAVSDGFNQSNGGCAIMQLIRRVLAISAPDRKTVSWPQI